MRHLALATVSSASRKTLESNHNLNDTNTATPTRRPQARPSNRTPLQSRDNNAMMRVPLKAPLASKPGNANSKMPFDKQQRPIMPTLSASAKTANRTPLTPKVAGSNPPSGTTTPVPRRNVRPDTTLSTVSRDDASYLSNNITPRSGSRKSRVDSPNHGIAIDYASPNEVRTAPASSYNGGLNINGTDKDIPKRPTVSFSPSVSEVGSRAQNQNATQDTKFFFASDAKTVTQPARPPLPSKTSSSSTFLYANGETIAPLPQSSSTPVGAAVGEERTQPRFFLANGTPDLPPANYPPRPSSVLSTSSRASPRIGTASPATTLSPLQRPASPTKLNQYASITSLRSTPSLPSPVLPRPQVGGRGQTTTSIVSARRASIEGQRLASHGRSSSVGASDIKPIPTRRVSGGSQIEPSSPASPLNSILGGLPVSTPEEVTEEVTDEAGLRSPIKTGKTLDELNELAANARRERKVLDLEITNSSLEAINRTLEREMRKQTAELRRYRRLSRSGRLSINTAGSTRSSIDGVLQTDGETGTILSDMSEEDEEEEEESEFSEDEFSDDASLTPSAMAESDARHRKRDEKRLQLDLSKHQQLLVDSQKMNQSLKRCLGWTEVLINEGKKALEYNVKISDVELGGRVLALDEIEERRREEENEGMSDIGAQMLREARERQAAVAKQIHDDLEDASAWGDEGRDDRDSGIEVDTERRDLYAGIH